MALPHRSNPSDFGINSSSGAGKGMKPSQGVDWVKWKKRRYWFRSECCDARVKDTDDLHIYTCTECSKVCIIKND